MSYHGLRDNNGTLFISEIGCQPGAYEPGGQGPPSFQKMQKVPFFQWQSALCLCEKCCSDCIFYLQMLQSNICESLWLLECGAVKQ